MISLIIPCFNEEESLPLFYPEATSVLRQMNCDYELIFVNDGSRDRTLEILKELSEKDPHVIYLSFSRNFGKEAAMYAGFCNAGGDYVAVMDADLQDPPSLLPEMLEKLELLEVDEEDTSALRLKFPPSPRSGSYPVIMEGVGKTYGDKVVFRNANLTIERGDKVAFVGKNGEGKSTLVKCIMKEIEHDGTLTLGHNVQIGYFAQNQASLMDENLTVFQTIDDVAKGDIRNKIRDLLGAFMFGGPEESMKKVKVLSGGERTRLAMIKLLLEPVNLLILDEPTNHLDMKTKDILKQALLDFDGTLIVVSHDRDFLDGLVTKVYEFGNQKVTEHLCGIYEFLEKKKMDSLQELEKK